MGKMDRVFIFVILSMFSPAHINGDNFLHVPRGCNNRLNEKTETRKNANRLFDSQNNDRGGYNVGDKYHFSAGENHENQYMMRYFQSGPWKTLENDKGKTFLNVEWTNQHGCGGNENESPQKQNCDLILQYMCQDDVKTNEGTKDSFRNGITTNAPRYTNANHQNVNDPDRKRKNQGTNAGQHESWDWYNKCYLRERNQGLFTADQNPKRSNGLGYSAAVYTRQNPNGNRHGYECPEERDYHPYWHPTPWVDVAILTENSTGQCIDRLRNSFNVRPYGQCKQEGQNWSRWNRKDRCEQDQGTWYDSYSYLEKASNLKTKESCEQSTEGGVTYKWAIPYDSETLEEECLVMHEPPVCREAPWTRSNHLGNSKDAAPVTFKWTLPYFPSGKTKRCVFRIRYNISTDDYDPYNTDSKDNRKKIRQNPYVYALDDKSPLRLAINTAQFGRTFSDRSHVFKLMPRKSGLTEARIHNLNVRGKRGNIVQTYPGVVYDFAPNRLEVSKDDLVHIQWTGSNTHNNDANGGDGQAGAAGIGEVGTDRHNFVEMVDRKTNFPTPFENTKLWKNVEIKWIYHGKKNVSMKDLAIDLATSGYYRCESAATCPEESFQNYLAKSTVKEPLNNALNNADATYRGVLLRFTSDGAYHYFSTRNNLFGSRSQKASIIVKN